MRRSRLLYWVWMAGLTTAYVILPDAPRWIWTLIGTSSVAAIVVGARAHHPRHRLAWSLVAAGTATFIAGDTAYDLLTTVWGYQDPFPSIADVLYLCTYPLFAAGLLLVVRSRSGYRNREALLDALIVTIGLGLVVWLFLAAPYVEDRSLSLVEKGFSIAYPVGDVLLLAMLVRLLIGGGVRSSSIVLLTVGTLGLLVSDLLYGLIQLDGTWQTGGLVDLGWVAFYAAWGGAALQPDMVKLTEPARRTPRVMTRARLLLLVSVSLIPPVMLLWSGLTRHAHDLEVNALASAALFVLVIMRLDGVVQVAHRSTTRENVLRRTGEALVGASGHDAIQAVAVDGISTMLRTVDDRSPWVVVGGRGTDHAAVHAADGTPPVSAADLKDLVTRHEESLLSQQFVLLGGAAREDSPTSWRASRDPVLLAALVRNGVLSGGILISGPQIDNSDVIDAICAIASQVALAVDSAELTAQVLQRQSEAHFRSLIQNTSDIILVVDDGYAVTYHTPSLRTVLGLDSSEVVGRSLLSLLHGRDSAHATDFLRGVRQGNASPHASADGGGEWRLFDASGHERAFEVTCSNLLDDPNVRGLVLTLHEITERRALEVQLKHLAFHDSLTRLPNRALFMDRVEHALARWDREGQQLTVMLIDLDDFKLVNDTRGHAAGDALLVTVAQRLQGVLRPEDTCARLGGDEFAVLVEGVADGDTVDGLADRILTELRLPVEVDGVEIGVGASVGLSSTVAGGTAEDLLVQADLAMYAAKDAGKGGHEVFRTDFAEAMQSRLVLRRELLTALGREEFALHYQPVVDLLTHEVTGVEALIRWIHPERGLVMPGDFIDAVEEGDLAVPLGEWVIETAVAQAAQWQRLTPSAARLSVSVNVAPRQLRDPGFADMVARAIGRHGLEPGTLVLEITERTLAVREPQIVLAMTALRALGVGLALDDFGTGYAALGYLRRFPVTMLKIDRSFVSGVDRSEDDHALVDAIVRLGATFGLGLVAEGIETAEQRDTLVALGCRHGQGFWYFRPLSVAETTAVLLEPGPRRDGPAVLAAARS